jgi:WD40 repeat protein
VRQIGKQSREASGHGLIEGSVQPISGGARVGIFDARLMAAIVVASIVLVEFLPSDPVVWLGPSRVSHGQAQAQVVAFAMSPANGLIATTNTAGRVVLRGPERHWQVERILDYAGRARTVAISPDGRLLAVGESAVGVHIWDLGSTPNGPTEKLVLPVERAKHMAFSPDNRCLAVAGDRGGTIALWDVVARKVGTVLEHTPSIGAVAFSPDGRWLAMAGDMPQRSIVLWDRESAARQVVLEENGAAASTVALAFSPDGSQLASAGFPEHFVRLFDLKNGRVRRELVGHERPVNSVAFSPDGALLATAANDGTIGLWCVATGQRQLSLDGQASHLRSVAFAPDGRTLLMASGEDDDIRMWDVAELLRSPNSKAELVHAGS